MTKSESQDAEFYTLLWGTDIKYPSQTKKFNDSCMNFVFTQILKTFIQEKAFENAISKMHFVSASMC